MSARTVIVTGAGGGTGRAAALQFAKSKDRLILTDRNAERGLATLEDVKGLGATASFIEADLSKKLDVHNVIAEALDSYDRVHVLAHCDSAFSAAPLLETSERDYEELFDRNVRAAFLVNRAVAREIVKSADASDDGGVDVAESGAIVNVISSEAVTASADHALFAATQGAIMQLTKSVAMTLSAYGARANCVGIAGIKSELDDQELSSKDAKRAAVEMTPLARRGNPEEAAAAVHFLAGKGASFITGQTIFVDGGRLALHRKQAPDQSD